MHVILAKYAQYPLPGVVWVVQGTYTLTRVVGLRAMQSMLFCILVITGDCYMLYRQSKATIE